MKKKMLSLALVISILASLFVAMPVSADADSDLTTITVSSVTVEQGEGTETVEVPITLAGNPGLLGLQLKIKYAEGLTLTGVEKGDALTALAFTKPGDLTANPITLMWDGESNVDTSNGVIATLTFTVPKDTEKDYAIEITNSIVLDEDMGDVEVTIVDGKISVGSEPDPEPHVHEWDAGEVTTEPTCTQDGVKTYMCTCGATKTDIVPAKGHTYGDWTADGDENHKKICECGDEVIEAHSWDEGIVTVEPTADAEGEKTYTCVVCKETKTEVIEKIKATTITVSEVTVEQGTETVEVPISIAGNTGILGLQLQVQYTEGLTLTGVEKGEALTGLSFTAPGDLTADPITLMWDGESNVDTSNGVIATLTFTVPADAGDYAIEITNSIVLDEDLYDVEVTIVDGKVSVEGDDPIPEPPTSKPTISVSEMTVEQGIETVEVPISIAGNTGILGLQLKVKYAEGLTLTGVEKGEALTALAFTKPGDLTADPITLMWDGESNVDTSNGVIATLTFTVPADAGDYAIEIANSIVLDEDMYDVEVTIVDGKIIVVESEPDDPCKDGHTDANNDHNCDICGEAVSDCADNDNDHNCDICDEVLSGCADNDNDHNCDVCGEAVSECADDDYDHNCDICGEAVSECADDDYDHNCDICGEAVSECADDDYDHNCDICDEVLSGCADNDNDHNCDVCGEVVSDCADNDNDHNCDVCGTTVSDCADANNDHKCDVCGTTVSDCADANNDHNCDVCGTKLSECSWDAGVVSRPETCTEDGIKTYTCTVCGATKTEAIPAKGHTYGTWEADGDNHKKTCACGDVVTEAHDWSEGVVTTPPTATTEGIKTYTCTVCNHTKQEPIGKLNGTTITVSEVTVAGGEGTATVEVPISIEGNSGILGMTLTVKYGDGLTLTNVARGDALSSLSFTKPGNFSANPVNMVWDGEADEDTSNGSVAVLTFTVPIDTVKDFEIEITQTIAIDNDLEFVDVMVVDGKISVTETHTHAYGNWVADGDNHKKTCSCGHVITEAHAWDDGEVTVEPTVTTEGEKTYTCTVCGATRTEVIDKLKPAYTPGDVDDNGIVESRDIILVRRHIAGGYNIKINTDAADVDKNGIIESRDIILIRRHIAGGYGVVLK